MIDDLKSALIAGAVALIVALLSAIVTYFSNKKVLKHARYESKRGGITTQRMDWISQIRNVFASLLAFEYEKMVTNEDEYKMFYKTVQLLKLYLNFAGYIDRIILDDLDQLTETMSDAVMCQISDPDLKGTFERVTNNIQKYAHIYLKAEWNRVKFESDPKNQNLIYEEEKAIRELERSYEKTNAFIMSRPCREATAVRKMNT